MDGYFYYPCGNISGQDRTRPNNKLTVDNRTPVHKKKKKEERAIAFLEGLGVKIVKRMDRLQRNNS